MAASGQKANNPSKSSTAQPNGNGQPSNGQIRVGPEVEGNKETYQLVRRLQSALFGGVYEAKGLTSGRDFAIKVLHKSELDKAKESTSIEFCEVPLSEIRFADLMRGHQHVMEPEEHFEDEWCFYVVFELCRGGDLLEALKLKPRGFDEAHAQCLIRQAAKGMAYLHARQVAMQDVSLENMLLHVNPEGEFQVKICDPGQAVVFQVDEQGAEMPVQFRGLVGKSFRPPELHEQVPYMSTKVDSWCLGWSTYYLLTAQPLFLSCNPSENDTDWLLFQNSEFDVLFRRKSNLCKPDALDFIFRLLQIEPRRRMSINDALNHKWLANPSIPPVLAPKEMLPEPAQKSQRVAEPEAAGIRSPPSNNGVAAAPRIEPVPTSSEGRQLPSNELPTWAGASQQAHTPMLRVRSPPRSPRASGATTAPRISSGRRQFVSGNSRAGYVIATAHSPTPGAVPASPTYGRPGGANIRTASPLQSSSGLPPAVYRTSSPGQYQYLHSADPPQVQTFRQDGSRQSFLTPRSASRPTGLSIGGIAPGQGVKVENTDDPRGRGQGRASWTFRADGSPVPTGDGMRMGSGGSDGPQMSSVKVVDSHGRPVRAVSPSGIPVQAAQRAAPWAPQGRTALSPARPSGAIYFPRTSSPTNQAPPGMIVHPGMLRAPSPVAGGFSWAQAPSTFSPRAGSPVGTAMPRAGSPGQRPMMTGFAWSPDPPSPRMDTRASPRSFSPAPGQAQIDPRARRYSP